MCLVTKNTHKLLQMHSQEHPVGLYHHLVRQLLYYPLALQRVVRSAQRITGGKLPALQAPYSPRCHMKDKKIIKDNNHPSHCLFTLLTSRR